MDSMSHDLFVIISCTWGNQLLSYMVGVITLFCVLYAYLSQQELQMVYVHCERVIAVFSSVIYMSSEL
jgi:hypothetical protein